MFVTCVCDVIACDTGWNSYCRLDRVVTGYNKQPACQASAELIAGVQKHFQCIRGCHAFQKELQTFVDRLV